jgi:GTP-binding protein
MNSERVIGSVAIVGRPNVGKSALFNRLVGRSIAIVHDQPGITRDRISAKCIRGARPFLVWDTGGVVGAGESELRQDVRQMVNEAIRQSDVLLFVVDAKEGLSPIDRELARIIRKSRKPILLTINKIDDPKHDDRADEFTAMGFAHTVPISAAHGRGISDLLEQLDRLLPSESVLLATASDEAESDEHKLSLKVAIIGRPNAGKSSLINAVVQSERAIVSELPGTTRDAVDIVYARGEDRFTLIDTAGMRRRGSHSTSVEVFSVMRAERSVRRSDLCVLMVDLTSGVTAQDKRIAGMIQKARKAAILILNKWDLFKPKSGGREAINELVQETRRRAFFIGYAPVLVASAKTGENVELLFKMIAKIRRASQSRIGTGILNRLLRDAFAANPPPMVSGKRLKLFYAAQSSGAETRSLPPPEFVLFVNDPKLLSETYQRYLEGRIREKQPYPGLPVLLTCRPRKETRPR